MAAPVERWVYVKSTGRRYHYDPVEGDDMAYDESSRIEPRQEGDEVVAELTDLDTIKAEMGLIDLHLGRQLVNWIWRAVGFDKAALGTEPSKVRLYRIGDPRHGQ